ncbi:6-phosphogluconate dehydrogenase [Capsaspora owczarzaki ATCC 30864]|uniref:6-phosphogluconate dehydrogenase, decarboxylating n=1 Tax=Capsaspora owczarzaki (strain ATCC 30864) TaxID=595528 RepID=A0A0D2WWJ7_CAPO3|nr:6-phosphogluconate dehydrogenase [Capsaspora owczarzaki ATCC 30864]KJE97355.1 6-phosphogluconate dehydrogenase [Capsaspora owczarzaki ATCC 30864]|eukprot:XP_004343090.1 6-phosphogluconate dehydrogenase [Capsaspora owczarzaki ATCC 30864]
MTLSKVGLVGLAVMGQNLALNVASKGFQISVFNRSYEKTQDTERRAKEEGNLPLVGFKEMKDFVASLEKPRRVIILVQAGKPVDETIAKLSEHLEAGDLIVDGGNEWYENTERRAQEVAAKGLLYMGMGVSGGESGARNGPSLMPGGPKAGYDLMEPIITKIAAQVDGPCVTHIGPGGAGNYVKMIHNGIEYGDMQLIAEAYDILRTVGGFSNAELKALFEEWNRGELESFLIEITAQIFGVKDPHGEGELVDKILDKTGMKGTGKWTVQTAAEISVPVPTISAALDSRLISGLKEHRVQAAKLFSHQAPADRLGGLSKKDLADHVRRALYASKICSYAQGLNIIRTMGEQKNWNLQLGSIARIWKGGCIIRAVFLDRIKKAFDRDALLPSLLFDPEFANELQTRQASWRKVVSLAIENGIAVPAFSGSLAYFDAYRRERSSANLVQAQRDFFGAHTFERTDKPGSFHQEWAN